MRFTLRFVIVLALFTATSLAADNQPGKKAPAEPAKNTSAKTLEPKLFENLQFRSIGPANMGGRMAEVLGVPGHPEIMFTATAAGGLFRTTNGGANWQPIFDKEDVLSIGAIAIEPHNPDVIWVGTGEGNIRNTVSFGDGVYKTTDGGKTWTHLGLKDSEHITRIVINPRNPEMVYVAALGHPFGPNEERGVFMTTDGGATWKRVLYTDADHGAADLDIDPQNPNVLYATMWHAFRRPWTFTSGDEKGGVYKSVDGGRTWKQLTEGLPKLLGRSGVRVATTNPSVVYVIAEAKEGTLFRSDDQGEHFHKVNDKTNLLGRGLYYARMTIDPTDENRIYAIAMSLHMSSDGGQTWKEIGQRTHGDHHSVWVDPLAPNHILQGDDGGIYVSDDRGTTWKFFNNFPIGQFYTVYADNREPFYWVMGGLQDNGDWAGPSRSREPQGILNADWRMVQYGDGFYIVNNPKDPNVYLSDSQGGNLARTELEGEEQADGNPQPRRNDGGPVGELKYRFNWNTPIIVSPHDPNTVYTGGNLVFKSTDFGKTWSPISPDLTTNDPSKTGQAGGPIWLENTTAEYYETIISLAESPVQRGLIWAGTDDGQLWMTSDGGEHWTNVIGNVKGVPRTAQVSRIELSRGDANTAFVSFENHMFDDFHPYIFKTTDGGKSWTNLTGNLPEKDYVWAVRQDPKNPNLLYAGTELGLFASFTGGNEWIKLRLHNLPPVAVRDIKVHPRENDLLIATHGRSVQIFDDATVLQEITPEILGEDAHLFGMRPALRVSTRGSHPGMGDGSYVGPNPPYGALVTYYLKDKLDPKAEAKIEVLDSSGNVIREIKNFPREAGLNRVPWDMRIEGPKIRRDPTPEERERMQSFFFRGSSGPQVLPGTYKVRLTVNGKKMEQPVAVRLDPTVKATMAELQQQYDVALKLRDMISVTNLAMRSLDSVDQQMHSLETTVHSLSPDAPPALHETISADLKSLDTLELKLVRSENAPPYSLGPRLSEQLQALFSDVERVNGAPTKAEMELFNDLQGEFQQRIAEVRQWNTETLAKLNSMLQQNKIAVAIWDGNLIPENATAVKTAASGDDKQP